MNIRALRADEIECRVQTVKQNGCSLLLYKDARCDMRILDEVFGPMGWERQHELINGNLFCTVRVWDIEKQMWISKQDVGTESYTEKEKGQASDSFKRACFNIGIGRELYTSPFIWIKLGQDEVEKKGNSYSIKTKFKLKEIAYNDNKEIVKLVITDDKGKVRYQLGRNSKVETSTSATVEQPSTDTHKDDIQPTCALCKTEISIKVHDYSIQKYNKPLCYECQKKVKAAN